MFRSSLWRLFYKREDILGLYLENMSSFETEPNSWDKNNPDGQHWLLMTLHGNQAEISDCSKRVKVTFISAN